MRKKVTLIAGIGVGAVVIVIALLLFFLTKSKDSREVWLQRYEEQEIEISKGNFEDYKWTSSDESVVTVENGKLVAQKTSKDPVTVVGKKFLKTINITVKRVNDTAGKPKIVLDDSVSYLGLETELSPKIVYDGKEMDVSLHPITYQAEAGNTELASVDGVKVTGLALGETEVILKAEYKGLTITGTGKITVKPSTYVEVEQEELTLYNADNKKVNQKNIDMEVCEQGKLVKEPQLSYRIVEGDEGCVRLEDNTVIAQAVGSATVEISLQDKPEIVDTFVVKVDPPYEPETFEIADLAKGVSYEPYKGNVGGRTEGLTRYMSGTLSKTPEGWNDIWPNRVVNSKIGGDLIEAYRSGYRYFTYDIYLTGPSELLLGYTNGGTTYNVPYDTFFYTSWVKILDENGEVLNRVVAGRWLTVVYDMYAFILEYPTATLSYFYTSHVENMEVYFSNICYRMDDSFMVDDGVSYEKENDYVQATNCEFHSYANADNSVYKKTDKEVAGVTGAYQLIGGSDDYLQNTMVAVSSLGTSRGDSLYRLSERGKYITFDLYVEEAEAVYFSLLSKEVEFAAAVGVTDFSECDWISIIANGKQQYTLEKGRWQTVCIDYEKLALESDIYVNTPAAFEIALMNKGDIAYINNVRYYQKDSFIPKDYEGTAPSGLAVKSETKASLEDITTGEFAGSVLYTNVSGNGDIYFREVQNKTKASVFFIGKKRFITMGFYLNEGAKSFALNSSIIRSGYTIQNSSTVTVGKKFSSDGNLTIYDTDGNAVNQVEAGKWYTLSFYVEYMDKPEHVDVTFHVNGKGASAYLRDLNLTKQPLYGEPPADASFVPGWVNTDGSEASIVQVLGGKFAGTERYINWTQSEWSGASFAAIKDGSFYAAGYKYMSYDFYLTEDVKQLTFFAWVTNPSVKNTAIVQSVEVGSSFAHQDNVYFYDASGNSVQRLEAGQWYTVTIQMNYPDSPDWSFVSIRTSGVNGSACYLKNFRGSNKMPYKYREFGAVVADPMGFVAGDGAQVTDARMEGVFVKKAVLEDNGKVFFEDVIDSAGHKGDFFASAYKYVTFDMYVDSATAFLFNTSTHNIWLNGAGYDWSANPAGEFKQGDYLRTYVEGYRTPLNAGLWYTVCMKVENYSPTVDISACGGPATIYLKNLTFTNDYPTEIAKLPLEPDPLGFVAGKDVTLTSVKKDGEKVIKAVAKENSQIYFKDVITEKGTKGKFFLTDNRYVTFDMYVESTGGFLFNTSTHNIWTNGAGYDWSANPAGDATQGDFVRTYVEGYRTPLKAGYWYTVSMKAEDWSDTVNLQAIGGEATVYLKNLRFNDSFPTEVEKLPIDLDPLGFIGGTGTVVSKETKDGEEVVKAVLYGDGQNVFFKNVITEAGEKGKFFLLDDMYVTFDMYVESTSGFLFNTSTQNIWTNGTGYDWSGNGMQGSYLRTYVGEFRNPLNTDAWYTVSMKVEDYSNMVSIQACGGPATIYLKNLTFANDFPKEVSKETFKADPLGFVAGKGTTVTEETKDGETVVKAVLSADGNQVYFKDVITEGGAKELFFVLGYKYVTFDMYVEDASTFLFNTSTHNIWTNAAGYDWSNNAAGSMKQGDYLRSYVNGKRTPLNRGAWYTVSMRVDDSSNMVSIAACGNAATIYLKNLTFADSFPETDTPPASDELDFRPVDASKGATAEKVTEGEFAGTVKFTSSAQGSEWDGYNRVGFQGVDSEKTKVEFEVYFANGYAITPICAASCWWSTFGHAAGDANLWNYLTVTDADGNSVQNVTSGQWYKFSLTIANAQEIALGFAPNATAYFRNLSVY